MDAGWSGGAAAPSNPKLILPQPGDRKRTQPDADRGHESWNERGGGKSWRKGKELTTEDKQAKRKKYIYGNYDSYADAFQPHAAYAANVVVSDTTTTATKATHPAILG
jgi:hypothetical protein